MPEFERKKRRSLTNQQLYDEYYGNESKKTVNTSSPKKRKNKNSAQGKSANTAKRENPPISAERQRIKERYPLENSVWSESAYGVKNKKATSSKNSKAYKRKTAAKGKKSVSVRRKKKRHGSYILYYFLCGIVAAAVVTILSVTVLFNISVFEVRGATAYTEEEIIAACGIKEGDNLLRIDIGSAEKKIISELVYIDTAKISRGFPNKLIIETEPAVPAASFLVSGKYYLVSEMGRILEIISRPSECPVVMGYVLDPETETVIGGQLAEDDEKRVATASSIIGYMKLYGLTEDCTIDLTDTLNIKISYDDRIEMELGTSAAMDSKIYNASLLIENEIAENEKCSLILTNPNRVPKRPIRDENVEDEGYIVTEKTEETEEETEEEPDEAEGEEAE